MNTQTMPWFKFAHVEYLLDPMITSLSLAAQGANTRLMAYAARQLPFGTLPNDEKTLLAMVGIKSSKQWQKIYAELMGAVWFLNDDGRLYCSLMIVESSPVNQKEKDKQDNQANDKTLTNAERCKRYRDNKKNVGDTNDTNSDTLNMSSDTTATRKQHDTDTAKSVDSVSFEGGKGGDLDLDLDLDKDLEEEQEVKTKTSRDASVCDARFDLFWKNYPRKEKKQDAIKSWKKIKPNETLFNEILSAIDQQKTWASWLSGYIPHATTWLNGKRWEDEQPRQQNIVPLTNRPNSQSWQSKEDERKAFNKAAQEEFLRSFNSDNVIDGVSRHVG